MPLHGPVTRLIYRSTLPAPPEGSETGWYIKAQTRSADNARICDSGTDIPNRGNNARDDTNSRDRPTYTIWLLGQTLRPQVSEVIHQFRLRDEQGRGLLDHGGYWHLATGYWH